MGPLKDVVEKLPFFQGGVPSQANFDDYELVKIESMINSMTPSERKTPDSINDSRVKRIANGSGRQENEVRDLLSKFKDMRDLMSAMGGGKLRGRWKRLKGLKRMFSGGLGNLMGGDSPATQTAENPFGLPEVSKGQQVSKKTLEKQRKKNKEARKARKKSRR
jgi:signal recognition particle subunit SRP54